MFDINNSFGFYKMLIDDWDAFMDDPQSARLAIHCASTAFHLYEWVWGDFLKSDKTLKCALGVKDRATFLKWIDARCTSFRGAQDLTNGAKHFIRDQGFQTQHVSGFGRGPYGVGPYGTGYLLIDYGKDAGNHRYQPAAQLLEVVVRFWREFFKSYRPDLELPTSRHQLLN